MKLKNIQRLLAVFLSALLVMAPISAQAASSKSTTETSKSKTKSSGKRLPKKTSGKQTAAESIEDYPPLLIGPGDLLSINVLGYEHRISQESGVLAGGSSANANLPTDYLVSSDGRILFPYVGAVTLTGLSPIDAGLFLMKKLSPYMKYPQVTVLITQTNTYNVSVMGNVMKPAQYMIRGKPTLVSMVAQAGGPAPGSRLGGVILTHGNDKLKVDLGELLKDRSCHKEGPLVYPGDIIYVPKSSWPTIGEMAIVASILYSATITYQAFKKR